MPSRGPVKTEFCTDTFPKWVNEYFDTRKYSWLEIDSSNAELYKLLCKYGVEHSQQSFIPNIKSITDCLDKEEQVSKTVELGLGHGIHKCTYENKQVYIVHGIHGEPVGTNCGLREKHIIHLFIEGIKCEKLLCAFMNDLLAKDAKESPKNTFRIYRWHNQYNYWYQEQTAQARHLDTVHLPSKTKDDLVSDMKRFLTKRTKEWYQKHGIPYKRSYIFYGPPGTGKTSMIQALAGAFRRHVCFLQPNGPKFTDDAFKTCLQKVPKKSILILEDIDSLFDCRNSKNAHCPLTFTGLLNGLDGIGNSSGQIFILTTNHLERLDPALIRCGRVDRKFEFGYADDEQLSNMFKRFYPDAKDLAQKFVSTVRAKWTKIVMADLQQLFIQNMDQKPEDCVASIEKYQISSELVGELEKVAERLEKAKNEIRKRDKIEKAKKAAKESKELQAELKKINGPPVVAKKPETASDKEHKEDKDKDEKTKDDSKKVEKKDKAEEKKVDDKEKETKNEKTDAKDKTKTKKKVLVVGDNSSEEEAVTANNSDEEKSKVDDKEKGTTDK